MSLPIDQMKAFATKYKLGEDGLEELQQLFDNTLVHVANCLLETQPKQVTKKEKKKCSGKSVKTNKPCRNNALEGSDFCKSHKPKEPILNPKLETEEPILDSKVVTEEPKLVNKETKVTKEKNIDLGAGTSAEISCNGLINGKKCKQKGKKSKPEGANNFYCFKCKSNWKDFEGQTPVLKPIVTNDIKKVDVTKEVSNTTNYKEEYITTDDELFGPETDDELENESKELTKEQEKERKANDMTLEQYKESVEIYDRVEKEMSKKMKPEELESWKNDQLLEPKIKEKVKVEIPKKIALKKKKTVKRPTSWVKKQKEKIKKNNEKMEKLKKEMLEE